jgi:hypothetical protein
VWGRRYSVLEALWSFFCVSRLATDDFVMILLGNIEFGMLNKHAPNTAAHFIKLAEEKVLQGGSLYRYD